MQHEREEQDAEREVEEPPSPTTLDEVLDTRPRPAVEPVVVPRWVQLVTLPLALVGLVALLGRPGRSCCCSRSPGWSRCC